MPRSRKRRRTSKSSDAYRRSKSFYLSKRRAVIVKPEKKFLDKLSYLTETSADTIFSPVGNVRALCQLGQGVGPSQRLGSKVQLSSLLMRYTILTQRFSTRIAIVLDKTGTSTPVYSDVFSWDNATGGFSTHPYAVHAPRNMNNLDRFVVLFDNLDGMKDKGNKEIGVNPADGTDLSNDQDNLMPHVYRSNSVYLRLNHIANWGNDTGINPKEGQIYLVTCGSNNYDESITGEGATEVITKKSLIATRLTFYDA